MTGRKFSKEKKRHRSRLSGPEEGGGSERKRRSTEATRGLPEVSLTARQPCEGRAAELRRRRVQLSESRDKKAQLQPVPFARLFWRDNGCLLFSEF